MFPLLLVPPAIAFVILKGRYFFSMVLAIALLAFVVKTRGAFSVEFLAFVINGVLLGWVIAFAVKLGKSLFVIAGVAVLLEIVFQAVVGGMPVYSVAYKEALVAATNSVNSLFGSSVVTEKMANLQWSLIVPLSEAIKSVLYSTLLALILSRTVRGGKGHFHDFEMPFWTTWIFAVAIFISFAFGGVRMANLPLCGITALFLVNGLSVTRLFFSRSGRSRVGEVLFYAVQLWLMFLPVVVIGFLEHWAEFRSRILNPEVINSNDKNK